MGYTKYNWAANQIDDGDMCALYKRKEITGIPITKQIVEAVKEYITRKGIT